jgi:hypothetical protein
MAAFPEIAFYYPGVIWHHADAIKNLLLFFDGIGLLVPEYMVERPEYIDPSLAIPLRQQGLLHILKPEQLVDGPATELLATQMADIIHSGMLDDLAKDGGEFHELSMSRLGYAGDSKLAQMIFEELKARGLARESEDTVSIPMHHKVRNLVLVLLAQILRPRGDSLGLELSPVTDRPQLVGALTELLQHREAPSAAHVVASDLLTVGVDLSAIPIDEVLGFRADNLAEHRRYAAAVRSFVVELSQLSINQREKALVDRQAELDDLASGLRQRHRKAWKQPASIALGAAGAVWTATTGDPFGALFAATSLVAGYERKDQDLAGAFSFVFAAHKRFPY